MNHKHSTVLHRYLRTLGATVISAALVLVTNPAMVHDRQAVQALLVSGVVIPALVSGEKALRYGSDDGEGDVVGDDSAEDSSN